MDVPRLVYVRPVVDRVTYGGGGSVVRRLGFDNDCPVPIPGAKHSALVAEQPLDLIEVGDGSRHHDPPFSHWPWFPITTLATASQDRYAFRSAWRIACAAAAGLHRIST